MGKINKYSNLYDKNGNIIREVTEDGLKSYSFKEVQDLLDNLGALSRNGELDDENKLKNVTEVYMRMLNDPKYQAERMEMIQKLMKANKLDSDELNKSLQEVGEAITDSSSYDVNTNDEEYVESTEVENAT